MDDKNIDLLVKKSLNGDRQSFGRIVEQYKNLVSAVTFSMTGDLEQSEDLAQEAFIVAWQKLSTLRNISLLPAWLCGIARNMTRSWLRSQQNNPLNRSMPIYELNIGKTESGYEAAEKKERISMMWAALRDIPQTYREPMILFYRQEKSVREIALVMELSEDAVKQRLSRGRNLLKEEVRKMVEETLEATRPGRNFTPAVLAMLPSVGLGGAAAGGITAGGVAKGAGAAGKYGILSTFGYLVGPILGMTGGFFGMWASIRNAPTLRSRRFMLKTGSLFYAFLWLFFGYQAIVWASLWGYPVMLSILVSLGWLIYISGFLFFLLLGNRRYKRIVEEDNDISQRLDRPLEETGLSMIKIRNAVQLSLVLSFTGSAAIGYCLWIIPRFHFILAPAAAFMILAHYVFYRMCRKGMAISKDEASYNSCPPGFLIGRNFTKSQNDSKPSKKAVFWNNFFALTGSVFGPMAPILVSMFQKGRYDMAAVSISVGVLSIGIVLAKVYKDIHARSRYFFGLLLFMGAFQAALIESGFMPGIGEPGLPIGFKHLAALLYLGIFWIVAFAFKASKKPKKK